MDRLIVEQYATKDVPIEEGEEVIEAFDLCRSSSAPYSLLDHSLRLTSRFTTTYLSIAQWRGV